ncbi:hypothetical protein [Plantactinospora sp. KBS50]|uniref:hypothetical protein n=1 Tax=Plantactinospora sp. KBS50 TaxID=2024580 RepID=UPI000BAAD86E|nr:hypothetical protein [Plantactinospora sp. KBS50]ASW57251.1 hypothetical protein CIK06_28580 [Plantactinospora sp. KBS50]
MLRPSAMRLRRAAPTLTVLAGIAFLTGTGLLAGCGAPPQPRATPGWTGPPVPTGTTSGVPGAPGGPAVPGGSLPGASGSPGAVPPLPGSVPPLPASVPPLPGAVVPGLPSPPPVARACAGQPSAAEVLAAVHRSGLIPATVNGTAATGPLCAADWQFTEFDVSGGDPLQVVTRRQDGKLVAVTAGTDVCSIDVRTAAPDAIRALACDAAAGQAGAA